MTTYTATLPNGETVTRKSNAKSYAFAVIVDGFMNTRKDRHEQDACVLNWCGSAALAQKAAEKAQRGGPSGHWTGVQIIEVTASK